MIRRPGQARALPTASHIRSLGGQQALSRADRPVVHVSRRECTLPTHGARAVGSRPRPRRRRRKTRVGEGEGWKSARPPGETETAFSYGQARRGRAQLPPTAGLFFRASFQGYVRRRGVSSPCCSFVCAVALSQLDSTRREEEGGVRGVGTKIMSVRAGEGGARAWRPPKPEKRRGSREQQQHQDEHKEGGGQAAFFLSLLGRGRCHGARVSSRRDGHQRAVCGGCLPCGPISPCCGIRGRRPSGRFSFPVRLAPFSSSQFVFSFLAKPSSFLSVTPPPPPLFTSLAP